MRSALSIFISKHWDAILASLAASIFIYLFTRHSGIGISPDSVVYKTVAENIRQHFSLIDFNGLPLVDFPAGYPAVLALTMLVTGLTVLQLAPLLNALLFSGALILTSIISNGHQKSSHLYKLLLLSVLVCSPCLLEVYSMVWSETLFIFFVLLFIVAAHLYTTTHRNIHLVGMGIVVALAFITRYAGITLFAVGLYMLLFDGSLPARKKIKHLLVFSIISVSLVLLNLIRNSMVAEHFAGVREKALRTVGDNIKQLSAVIAEWFPFIGNHATIAVIIFAMIFLFALCTVCYRFVQQQYFNTYETIIACFVVVYILFMLAVASVSRFEDLSSRLLSPVYIPLLLAGSSWIMPVMRRSAGIKKYTLQAAAFILYAGFQYHQYQLNAEAWDGIKDAGIPGYTEDSWTRSPTIEFIQKNKTAFPGVVYSNANDGVYFLTGLHARPLPHKEIAAEINRFLQQPSFHLAWFTDGENPDLVGLDFIKQHKRLVSVQEFEGGAVYLFSDSTLAAHP